MRIGEIHLRAQNWSLSSDSLGVTIKAIDNLIQELTRLNNLLEGHSSNLDVIKVKLKADLQKAHEHLFRPNQFNTTND